MPEVWPFIPRRDVEERLSWLTSVEQTPTAERREGLTQMMASYTYNHVLSGPELAQMERLLITEGRNSDYLFPIWSEAHKVGDVAAGSTSLMTDTNADFRSKAILWAGCASDQYHAADVTAARGCQLTLTSGPSTDLLNASAMPLRRGFIRSIETVREADRRFAVVTVDFELRFE